MARPPVQSILKFNLQSRLKIPEQRTDVLQIILRLICACSLFLQSAVDCTLQIFIGINITRAESSQHILRVVTSGSFTQPSTGSPGHLCCADTIVHTLLYGCDVDTKFKPFTPDIVTCNTLTPDQASSLSSILCYGSCFETA